MYKTKSSSEHFYGQCAQSLKKNWEGGEAPLIFGEGGDEEGVLTFQINTIF